MVVPLPSPTTPQTPDWGATRREGGESGALRRCFLLVGDRPNRVGREMCIRDRIKAYLTLKPGEAGTPEEFIDYVKERLAAYKYPRIVEVIAEMPKSATGKILKKELAHRR